MITAGARPAIALAVRLSARWFLPQREKRGETLQAAILSVMRVTSTKCRVQCAMKRVTTQIGPRRFIMEQWQPRTSYQHADAPDFELYDEKWDMANPQGSPLYIYWPIK